MADFRVVKVLNRSTAVLTAGPLDDIRATGQPHMLVGIAPTDAAQPDARERLAHAAFGSVPGFVDRHVTNSEMLRIDGQPVHEIRAEARDAVTGAPMILVQWLRFGQSAFVHILGVTTKDHWSRDFPKFRAVRDGIQPRR
jgi:hypothetical protein